MAHQDKSCKLETDNFYISMNKTALDGIWTLQGWVLVQSAVRGELFILRWHDLKQLSQRSFLVLVPQLPTLYIWVFDSIHSLVTNLLLTKTVWFQIAYMSWFPNACATVPFKWRFNNKFVFWYIIGTRLYDVLIYFSVPPEPQFLIYTIVWGTNNSLVFIYRLHLNKTILNKLCKSFYFLWIANPCIVQWCIGDVRCFGFYRANMFICIAKFWDDPRISE